MDPEAGMSVASEMSSAGARTPTTAGSSPGEGWKEVRAKETKLKPVKNTDVLIQEGWSGKVVDDVAGLKTDAACVCLATQSEAKKALAELSSKLPMGVLAPAKVDGKGEEIACLVTDATGKKQTRIRFLLQLGIEHVKFTPTQAKAGGSVGIVDAPEPMMRSMTRTLHSSQ